MGGDAGADRRRAHVDLADQHGRLLQPLLVLAEHDGVGAELLAQRHRHGVLQLGAPHLQDVLEFLGLCLESAAQQRHRVHQPENAEIGRDLQRRRIDVVGALAHVDVFVGMQELVLAPLMAHELQRTVGDDLVGVHIGGGAGAALNHVNHELVVQPARSDLIAGMDNGVAPLLVQQRQLVVCHCRGLLDAGERPHEIGVDGDCRARDRKILQRAQRVDAVIATGRNVPFAEQVVFEPRLWCGHDFGSSG